MDYWRIYSRLIDRSRARVLTGYVERHHVVPRCLGGTNSHDNIVHLTPEEHYVAHQLLAKLYPKSWGLMHAAVLMTSNTNPGRSNKLYGWMRRKLSARLRGRKLSAEYRRNIALAGVGRTRSPEAIAKMRETMRRNPRPCSLSTKLKIGAANRGRRHTEETKLKMSKTRKGRRFSAAHCQALRGKVNSPETRARMSAAQQLRYAERGVSPETRARMSIAARRRCAK